jgi:hypothetical protein
VIAQQVRQTPFIAMEFLEGQTLIGGSLIQKGINARSPMVFRAGDVGCLFS